MSVLMFMVVLASAADAPKKDPVTGLIEAPGIEMVKAHCVHCHSTALITQSRGDRARWKKTIRWMQETQNLWHLPPEVEETIVSYLETNYPPRPTSRRQPISASLMPPLPSEIVSSGAGYSNANASTEDSCGCRSAGAFPWIACTLVVLWRCFRALRLVVHRAH